MYLIFDATGVGKPKNYKAPVDDIYNWPRVIHLSWIVLDENLKPIQDFDWVIKPDNYHYTEEMAKAHGLDHAKVWSDGADIKEVLTQFKEVVENAKYVFAHNLSFNENVIGAEFVRANMRHKLHYSENYCLMHEGTYYCKIPKRGGGYKWPSLQELHSTIFKQGYTPSNNARADVIAASRCFIALMKAGTFDDILEED